MPATLNSNLNRILALLGGVLIVVSLVVLVTASGGSPAAAEPAALASVDRIDIADFKFAPAAVTVAVGTTITWTNTDNAPHTATSGATAAPDGTFDTGIIKKGQSRKVKLTKAGTFAYYCALHPFMKGTVVVR